MKDALDQSVASGVTQVSRYVAVLLRVHLHLLQEQLPDLKQAIWTIQSGCAERVAGRDLLRLVAFGSVLAHQLANWLSGGVCVCVGGGRRSFSLAALPFFAQLAVALPERLDQHLQLVAEPVVQGGERLREVGHWCESQGLRFGSGCGSKTRVDNQSSARLVSSVAGVLECNGRRR